MTTERTLGIMKPDAVKRKLAGAILTKIERHGFSVVALKITRLSREKAEQFYAVHRERPFFPSLITFMTSGPIVVFALQGRRIVEDYRNFIGATDPAKAAYGTVRREFGTSVEQNVVHGSDSAETAAREIAFFFSNDEFIEP